MFSRRSVALLALAVVCSTSSSCCVLWYCGPLITGSACGADAGACPTGYVCDTFTTDAGGFCTKFCSTFGAADDACWFSGDQSEGVCALPRPGGGGGLECTAPCDFDAGRYGCPPGLSCLAVDGGGNAAYAPGTCL